MQKNRQGRSRMMIRPSPLPQESLNGCFMFLRTSRTSDSAEGGDVQQPVRALGRSAVGQWRPIWTADRPPFFALPP